MSVTRYQTNPSYWRYDNYPFLYSFGDMFDLIKVFFTFPNYKDLLAKATEKNNKKLLN